jgi:hypothetical protein
LLQNDDILLLMALAAIRRITSLEGLRAVVARTAELAGVDVGHLDYVAALLHLEEAGLMTVSALGALVSMGLAVEHDLALSTAGKLHGLARRDRERGDRQDERNHHYDSQYKEFLHVCFTSFRLFISEWILLCKTLLHASGYIEQYEDPGILSLFQGTATGVRARMIHVRTGTRRLSNL